MPSVGKHLTPTARGHSVAGLDSRYTHCCRRADLPALERGHKSWSPTLKGRATPSALRPTPQPFCCQICSDSEPQDTNKFGLQSWNPYCAAWVRVLSSTGTGFRHHNMTAGLCNLPFVTPCVFPTTKAQDYQKIITVNISASPCLQRPYTSVYPPPIHRETL